jgi:porin
MPGRYRLGFWYDPRVSTVFDNTRYPAARGDDVGFYLGFDQMIWKENTEPEDSQGLGLFARYGHAHRDINEISDHLSAGLSYKGMLPTRDNDVTAFGVSQAILSSQYRHNLSPRADRETVYEWYYKYFVTPWFNISPDVQVITNPGGGKDARDAVVAGFRLQVLF